MGDNFILPPQTRNGGDLWAEAFLSHDDAARFSAMLALLSRHLNGPVVVTGSFAVEWQLLTKHGDGQKRRLNDIDLVAVNGLTDIGRGLKTDFLIHHFHPTREAGNVLVQLVEPHSQTRIDIFSARSPSVGERASPAVVDGTNCRIVSAEDLAARLLAIMAVVLSGVSVDAKYLDSLKRIMAVADEGLTDSLWSEYRRDGDPANFGDVFGGVTSRLSERSDLLKPTEYSQDITAECPWCVQTDDFPLAPRSLIFEILGYV